MNSSQPQRMAPIQRLPFELKAQIARELSDFDLYDQRNYQIDPYGHSFFNGHTYEWQPLQKAGDKPQLSFQPVYDDLRALSLVSKDFRDPAQRALFAVVIVGDPTAYFKLFRTLLESPQVRSYIRCLLAISVRNPDAEKRRSEIETSRWAAFVDIFGDLVVFGRHNTHDLRNHRYFYGLRYRLYPRGLPVVLSSDRIASYELESRKFCQLVTEVLHSILQLCQSLRAFHLHCSNGSWGQQEDPCTFWPVGRRCYSWTKALESDPFLNTLTIDIRVFEAFYGSMIMANDRFPPNIEHLTIVGSITHEFRNNMLGMRHVCGWLSAFTRLKTLRIWYGIRTAARSTVHNWNNLLLKLKATLEQLVLDGAGTLLHLRANNILGPRVLQQQRLFGPSLMLSCLPEMEKLRYLSVPIHYLRRCPDGMEPLEFLSMPNEGQDVRQFVEADVKFPKSLERAEVMMVQQVEDNRVTKVKALKIDLGKDGHTTGQIV
ncbi:hypothetical protein NCU17042 [Neurospora crassa OR74A]|uniref:Uncharacterized protein n=1 Tax=Neurospora crassa (strain ATCC 24698 / 74-OR23-1A / CBS 708.71 / DSM 1257 / FGSC 987) TaxID=367110 RepID=V5IPN0_NEUCR|nr:hypothetical protein NCU17042 [Neurospora crassa OR74A]ESA42721.1 hypothetical protein NCU17042 [Neurospora crassa OR74A]|eukprot:XP_011394856.1 hypothetical protein NCU17042 [Neurospora crassa OR74A]